MKRASMNGYGVNRSPSVVISPSFLLHILGKSCTKFISMGKPWRGDFFDPHKELRNATHVRINQIYKMLQ
jgi:hypothetical protein